MADFFVSYTGADDRWAQWISYVLEEAKYDVIVQAWDFLPGTNFVQQMQVAASKAKRTIMVLSPEYLSSRFASPEWMAAFTQDPQGLDRKLVPVMVRECSPPGMLAPIVQIRLMGLDEDAARQRLLDGVGSTRAKPGSRPTFPGAGTADAEKMDFPGSAPRTKSSVTIPYIPEVKRLPTDVEKRKFLKLSFEAIRDHFRSGLAQIGRHDPAVETDFHEDTASDFTAEIFVNGRSKCRSRIRIGGNVHINGIAISEGNSMLGDNGYNELLSVADVPGAPHLRSLMGVGSQRQAGVDLNQMTPEQAADYVWRRFVSFLER